MDATLLAQESTEENKLPLLSNTYKVINSSFICFNNYVIGSGSFGKVLYSLNVNQTEEYAIKFEKPTIKSSVLEEELTIYKNIYREDVPGVPKIYWYGEYKKYKIMVMDLLGPSLDKFYKMCNKQFRIDTAVKLGYQMIERIEHVHKMGYVHRDIKPNNFLLGKFNRSCSDDLLYIIDFGLSKDYICPDTGRHYDFSDNKRFVGTPRYASLGTHLGYKQSRRDDLESIIYVIIYFIKGELPWQGVKAKTKSEKKEKIKKKKKSISIQALCEGLPQELLELLSLVRNLEFKQNPDYEYYKQLLDIVYEKHKYFKTFVWDWEAMFLQTNEYPSLWAANKQKYEKLFEGYPIVDFGLYLDQLATRYAKVNMNLNNTRPTDDIQLVTSKNEGAEINGSKIGQSSTTVGYAGLQINGSSSALNGGTGALGYSSKKSSNLTSQQIYSDSDMKKKLSKKESFDYNEKLEEEDLNYIKYDVDMGDDDDIKEIKKSNKKSKRI